MTGERYTLNVSWAGHIPDINDETSIEMIELIEKLERNKKK